MTPTAALRALYATDPPEALHRLWAALEAEHGNLARAGARLGLTGTSRARTMAMRRLVALMGLERELAGLQHGAGRPVRRTATVYLELRGADLEAAREVLTPAARARLGDAPLILAATLDEDGHVRRAQLVEEG
jgi:hypothetical protein